MATALENEEIEGITAMAHKLLPLFTMLGANTSIAPLTWLEQRRGTTEMTSEIREKALFILDEIDRVIRQAEEQNLDLYKLKGIRKSSGISKHSKKRYIFVSLKT